jgi:hypothetical protein
MAGQKQFWLHYRRYLRYAKGDRSTSELMQHFYTNLAQDKQPTKAEALRLAQLSLLYGKQVTDDDMKRGIFVQVIPTR